LQKKYFPEHLYYFLFFVIVSILYITNGYASLATNDDWALRGMLVNEGVYGTLIMSYPLSFVISRMYDFFPSLPWYSILLSLVIGLNFYLFALYIEKVKPYLQKAILFILALLWLTFLWFNTSITIVTITTMVSAVGLIRKELILSFAMVLFASLLRTDMMFVFIPFYLVSYFILRKELRMTKHEIFALFTLVVLISSSLYVQKQDTFYSEWRAFNKARAAIVDMGILNVEKDYFSPEERFCITASWWQDTVLLSTEKIVATTPTLAEIIHKNIQQVHFFTFITSYKFKHWLWLLLAASLLVILYRPKSRQALFIPLLVLGVILLLITRDVERVTVPMIMLWAYILFENLKGHRIVNTLFVLLFTSIFYYYASGQLGYRYFKENTALQQEAHSLIKKSNKSCEVSINFPTGFTNELNTVFKANYLFHEQDWLQLNNKEILPTGWLSRHEFFYKTHDLSDMHTKRKYKDYHDYLIDDNTAFFGSKHLVKSNFFDTYLLKTYDKIYLKNTPECKHTTLIVAESEHFSISQIRIECNPSHKK